MDEKVLIEPFLRGGDLKHQVGHFDYRLVPPPYYAPDKGHCTFSTYLVFALVTDPSATLYLLKDSSVLEIIVKDLETW